MTKYYDLPQPDDVPIREKEDAMGAYFMMFGALAAGIPLPVVNLIAAIVYFYLNKKTSRFVHFHSLQSLLSQLPVTLINWGGFYILIRIIFFEDSFTDVYQGYVIFLIVANLSYFIFSLVAAVRARKGRFFYFLFFGRLSYHYAFRIAEHEDHSVMNKPPK